MLRRPPVGRARGPGDPGPARQLGCSRHQVRPSVQRLVPAGQRVRAGRRSSSSWSSRSGPCGRTTSISTSSTAARTRCSRRRAVGDAAPKRSPRGQDPPSRHLRRQEERQYPGREPRRPRSAPRPCRWSTTASSATAENEILPSCLRQNLGVLPRVPLASGFLSGKYTSGSHFASTDCRAPVAERSGAASTSPSRPHQVKREVPAGRADGPVGPGLVPAASGGDLRHPRLQERRAGPIQRPGRRPAQCGG